MRILIALLTICFSVTSFAATDRFSTRTGTIQSSTVGWQNSSGVMDSSEVTVDLSFCRSCGGFSGSIEEVDTTIHSVSDTTFAGASTTSYSEESCNFSALDIGSRSESTIGYMDSLTESSFTGTVNRFYGEYARGYEYEEVEVVALSGASATSTHEEYAESNLTTWRN